MVAKYNPILKGRGGREFQNGATIKGDDFMHLSIDIGRTTICGKMPDSFLLTYSDVEITCPKCIKVIRSPRSKLFSQA